MGATNIKKYEQDINSIGIKTSKIYFYLKSKNKSLILQEFINGYTLQEYFESPDVSNTDKLKMFRELIVLYGKTLQDDNLCLDWNLKNFIISKGNIVYIDYVPALYKDRIEKIKSDRLEQYKASYLDRQVQLAGIISYAIVPFFNDDKQSLKEIYQAMIDCVSSILNIDFSQVNLSEHVYIKKMKIISDYINGNQSRDSFIEQYKSISMEKTAIKKKIL